jgi:hypothetical protein
MKEVAFPTCEMFDSAWVGFAGGPLLVRVDTFCAGGGIRALEGGPVGAVSAGAEDCGSVTGQYLAYVTFRREGP